MHAYTSLAAMQLSAQWFLDRRAASFPCLLIALEMTCTQRSKRKGYLLAKQFIPATRSAVQYYFIKPIKKIKAHDFWKIYGRKILS